MSILTIVFWDRWDHYKASITLRVLDEEPDLKNLWDVHGYGLTENVRQFFDCRGFTLRQVKQLFPGGYFFYREMEEKDDDLPPRIIDQIGWSSYGIEMADLPQEAEGLQPLANLLNMPVIAYAYSRRYKMTPEKLFSVYPV